MAVFGIMTRKSVPWISSSVNATMIFLTSPCTNLQQKGEAETVKNKIIACQLHFNDI